MGEPNCLQYKGGADRVRGRGNKVAGGGDEGEKLGKNGIEGKRGKSGRLREGRRETRGREGEVSRWEGGGGRRHPPSIPP